MSLALDVNILLYASDTSSPYAPRAQELLKRLAGGRELFCIAWTTIMSYLRISTHNAIFAQPLSPAEAMHNVASLLRLPHVRVLSEEEGFWEIYCEIAAEVTTRGNLVPDAHLAAILRQHGIDTIYTNDRDFRKFGFLTVADPFRSKEKR